MQCRASHTSSIPHHRSKAPAEHRALHLATQMDINYWACMFKHVKRAKMAPSSQILFIAFRVPASVASPVGCNNVCLHKATVLQLLPILIGDHGIPLLCCGIRTPDSGEGAVRQASKIKKDSGHSSHSWTAFQNTTEVESGGTKAALGYR